MSIQNPLFPPFKKLSITDGEAQTLLGPLFDMVGKWTNHPGQGWNIIAVPGPVTPEYPNLFQAPGFILEVIPYIETTTFEPISVTLNRGQFLGGNPEEIQQVGAILYEQRIKSAGAYGANEKYKKDIENFFKERGFPEGQAIHAEQGMILNISNFNMYGDQELQIARMGTIPHGNAMLCLGGAKATTSPDIDQNVSAKPFTVDPARAKELGNGYGEGQYNPIPDLFTGFYQSQPNKILGQANGSKEFISSNHLNLSTENGTGGLLSIPFLGGGLDGTKLDTTKMTVDYWISKYKTNDGKEQLQLQYSQNISIVFPESKKPDLPIVWPHFGVNTMYKID